MKSIYFLSFNMISFVPYAYGFLKSYARQDPAIAAGYAWQPPFTTPQPVDDVVSRIVDPDLLCLSCYVWNHNQQMAVARRVKTRYPDCLVVCGGPHVPDHPGDFFSRYPQADILVHGEGEIPFVGLLRELLEVKPDFERLQGISFNRSGSTVTAPMGPRLGKNLPVPSPYLNGSLDAFLGEEHGNRIALWETNRGCPFACCFCDWGVRTKNTVRLHSMGRVAQEIEVLAARGVQDIYITDSNFGLFKRDLEIARLLVDARRRTGFPRRVRIQFAKTSNETVFAISRLLFENDMLWGTTLSMQSVDLDVLEAVARPHVDIGVYADLKNRYQQHHIPTYTELILGLPQESRETFVSGIGRLLEIGMHDDIRVFELALLPNAPLSQPGMRERYGLQTRFKPIRLTEAGFETEVVELVFGTRTMPYADWAYCLLFAEMIQALHNGAFTRFITIYLHREGLLSYRRFYDGLLGHLLENGHGAGRLFVRLKKLIDDYHADPNMPQVNRILTQPDMLQLLRRYHPTRRGWPLWTWLWLSICEDQTEFYRSVADFIASQGIARDTMLEDLSHYQQAIMLTPAYDPKQGKVVACQYNWQDYFFEGADLKAMETTFFFRDTHMGPGRQYPLAADDRQAFVTAAIGYSYPYSKFRHFFHQPDCLEKNQNKDRRDLPKKLSSSSPTVPAND
ncbi:B12-binding domain-containing radical SAM protein [Desulfosarcina sp.]|uniref:B12-binding domain-containing radical SAM protein n=1 Tax=Desulfosarcina sp. TaxID=2027861 RepID=UPI003970A592